MLCFEGHAQPNKNYFLDANIWIFVLKSKINLNSRDQDYINFFETFKVEKSAKIYVPVLLLSEVINRYLRDVACKKFAQKSNYDINKVDGIYYKNVFRPTKEFSKSYLDLCDNFLAFKELISIEFIPDLFSTKITEDDVLSNASPGLDFNDHYYFLLAKKHALSIVTDDADFIVDDVEIITRNKKLIDKENIHIHNKL